MYTYEKFLAIMRYQWSDDELADLHCLYSERFPESDHCTWCHLWMGDGEGEEFDFCSDECWDHYHAYRGLES